MLCGRHLEILNNFALERVLLSPRDNGAHARDWSFSSQIARLPQSPLPPEMGPLSHHPLSTSIPQPLPPSPSVGAWTVRVGHVPRSVLGQSKVKAILPWPHGYHSTFILSAPLDPDREAP